MFKLTKIFYLNESYPIKRNNALGAVESQGRQAYALVIKVCMEKVPTMQHLMRFSVDPVRQIKNPGNFRQSLLRCTRHALAESNSWCYISHIVTKQGSFGAKRSSCITYRLKRVLGIPTTRDLLPSQGRPNNFTKY